MQLRGEAPLRHLVEMCRALGVLTPEDPYPVWDGDGGPGRRRAAVPAVRLHVPAGRARDTKEEALAHAPTTPGVVVHRRVPAAPRPVPEPRRVVPRPGSPRPSARLAALDPTLPTVLVNHFPLVREPTVGPALPGVRAVVRHRAHRRLAPALQRGRPSSTGTCTSRAPPGTTGCRFEEVSVGYPREWGARGGDAAAAAPDPARPEAPQ